ncbi:MAG: AMP-binding protein [Synechococcales cyanobacterium CRU_2_2]|nr:AMP-binding protein [Synechococcales cyanobacterium CRU_2_2]
MPNRSLSRSLMNIFWDRVSQTPERVAYRFLADSAEFVPATVELLSYGSLGQWAGAIAQELRRQDAVGERVLLLYPPGLAFVAAFWGCLAAGAIAVPAYPPRPNQRLGRLQYLAGDSGARWILTTKALLPQLQSFWCGEIASSTLPVRFWATDESWNESWSPGTERGECSIEMPSSYDPDGLAFLQYTSGSTGQPKGVKISHRNLLHNLQMIQSWFGHSPESEGVIWLPPYHDMGLIGGVLQPLYAGFPVTLMAPATFLRQPLVWFQSISHFRATTSGAPNFAFERCVQRISPERCQDLDLSCWEVAFVGAEPVRAHTLDRFARAFSHCGFQENSFYPCYGLAEATLLVTGGDRGSAPTRRSELPVELQTTGGRAVWVSSGFAATDQSLKIVDPDSRMLVPEGSIGEIWIAGPSVAQGYWEKPQLTQEAFRAYLATGKGPYLRTGDLGLMQNGELFVTGRLKDLIIIRGQNIYPQDIEQTVSSSHELLAGNGCAVFTVTAKADEQTSEALVVVQELNRAGWRSLRQPSDSLRESDGRINAVMASIRHAVFQQHGLQVECIRLIRPASLPKTSSGKIQRSACKAAFEARQLIEVKQIMKQIIEVEQKSPPPSKVRSMPQPCAASERSCQLTDDRLTWLRDYASTAINSQLIDERRCIPPSIVLDFGNQGLLGMQVPQRYGGLELGHRDTLRILQQLGAIDPTLALFVGLNNVLGIRPILNSAQPPLRDELLPRLAAGRELAAFALTEAVAGSHPAAIRSVAQPIGVGRWCLTGEKIWSGSAAWAGVTNVFVQQQDAAGQRLGVSGFAVGRGTPGLRQGPEALTLGMRGMVQNTVCLDRVEVTAAQRLGTAAGGMAVAQDAMMYGRLAIAAASIGGMKRCAQILLRYANRRQVATGRLLHNPAVLVRLGGMTAAIAALETLVEAIAVRLDQSLPVSAEAYAACKILAPELYWKAADDLIQGLGGRGYIETNGASQILRDARILRIFEGPTETLAMYLGSRVLHTRGTVEALIGTEFNAPRIARALFEGAEQVLERFRAASASSQHHASAAEQPFKTQQATLLIGELASFAILWAAVQAVPQIGNESYSQKQALTWAKAQFEQRLSAARVASADEQATLSVEQAIAQIETYPSTIGEIEQNLAGEDYGLDAYLRKSQEKPPSNQVEQDLDPPSKAVADQSSGPPPPAQTSLRIQHWLIDWIARHQNIECQQIGVDQTFADHGLDSVSAVELAQDLEDSFCLPTPLDATVAWNFPTIAALANYVARQAEVPFNVEPTETAQVDVLDQLSEAELAEILASELALSSHTAVTSGGRQS